MNLELISGKKYYGRFGTGWVALVNGSPYHYTGRAAKREARAFINTLQTRHGERIYKTLQP